MRIADLNRLVAFRKHAWIGSLVVLWLAGVTFGLAQLWAYENRPGAGAAAPSQWPAESVLVPGTDRPTLIFLAHPQCTCTRASLEDLREVLARVPGHPKTYVLFLRPTVFAQGWEQTDLWKLASALPDATVLRDDDGVEAKRFGVETSGQTLLYGADRHLRFAGGVTGSRGHAGDNAGSDALVSLLTRGAADRTGTSVFGCPLFTPGS